MKISLERLDASALQVDLPGSGDRIVVRAAAGLRGTLERDDERLALSGVRAESIALETLRLLLGRLVLASSAGATFADFGLTLEQSKDRLAFELTATSLVALDLEVAIDDVVVAARVELTGVRLSVAGSDGSIEAERMVLSGFSLGIGEVAVTAERLIGLGVTIRWGTKGFSLGARSLEGQPLELRTKSLSLSTTGVAVDAFALDSRHIMLRRLAIATGQVAVTLSPPEPAPDRTRTSAPPPTSVAPRASVPASSIPAEPLIEWRVLDFLSGDIDVDVDLDLTVPIIGTRKATHRLRVPIERGLLDFRALENNLSALENALLDFSARDGALVLERVNPLFPARGSGKPLVIWDLDATDYAVAQTNRVRLAVLHRARMAKGDSEPPKSTAPPSRRSIALRKLGLLRSNVRLTLAPVDGPLAGMVRPHRVDALVLQGSVFHHPGAPPREASLLGELKGVALGLHGLKLGTTGLDVSSLTVASLSPIEIQFLDVHPTKVQLDLAGLAAEDLVVTLR